MDDFKSPLSYTDNRKANTWCNYTTRLDTYGCGCEHECSYCYAKGLLDFRGFWNNKPLKSDFNKIAKELRKLKPGSIVRMGGMTDCFQPIELKHEITYKTIELLNFFKIHYLIVTKSSLVTNDKYLKLYKKNLAHFQISITNTNDKDCYNYEKASKPSDRIKSIELLYSMGFDVSVRLSPLIEGWVDFDIINNIYCNKILIEFLKVNHYVRKNLNIDYSNYMVKYGGYDNLPLFEKQRIVKKITGYEQVTLGEYVREHHEYFKKHVNYNKEDCCNLNYINNKQYINQLSII